MSKPYHINLGKDWKRFVHGEPNNGLQLLGVVTHGAQIGALALRADGSYVQVNGDWFTPLNASRVRYALGRRTRSLGVPTYRPVAPKRTPTAPVQVVVRKRRTIVMP